MIPEQNIINVIVIRLRLHLIILTLVPERIKFLTDAESIIIVVVPIIVLPDQAKIIPVLMPAKPSAEILATNVRPAPPVQVLPTQVLMPVPQSATADKAVIVVMTLVNQDKNPFLVPLPKTGFVSAQPNAEILVTNVNITQIVP